MNNINRIVKEFQNRRSEYIKLDEIVSNKINCLLQENDFFVMDTTHRVKTIKSLRGKLIRKQGKYANLEDITDLCGVRIICYFSDTVDEIANKIREEFVLDKENSFNKKDLMNATQFGYLSLHYICSLKESDEYDEELCRLKFEIQMRTVLQHAWAEIEHDLGYKSEFGVPWNIRREFSQVAGLLEIADNQFVNIRYNTRDYVLDIREKIANGEAEDLMLDQVTLAEYIGNNRRFLTVVEKYSSELRVEVEMSNVDRYLELLDWFGIQKLGELITMFRSNEEIIVELIREGVNQYGLDIVTMNMIFRNLCIAELINSRYPNSKIRKFVELLQPKGLDNDKLVADIINKKEKYWKQNE